MGYHERNDYLLSFAEEIRKARRYAGYSREKLAEQAGVHPNTIALAERAERDLNIISQTRILAALGCRKVSLCDGCLDLTFSEEWCERDDLLALNDSFIISCIGETLRRKRNALGMTLEDLSSKTHLHINSLWNSENGLVIPKGNTLFKLYDALGIINVQVDTGGSMLQLT